MEHGLGWVEGWLGWVGIVGGVMLGMGDEMGWVIGWHVLIFYRLLLPLSFLFLRCRCVVLRQWNDSILTGAIDLWSCATGFICLGWLNSIRRGD